LFMSIREYEHDLIYVGKRIRLIRLSQNKSIRKFAKELNVSQGTLCEIENGKAAPSYKVLYLMGKKYGINLNWLVNGDGEMMVSSDRREDADGKFELLMKMKKYRYLISVLEELDRSYLGEMLDTLHTLLETLRKIPRE